MAILKHLEKKILEQLLDRDGYVLDFTNRTFTDFFNDHYINIDDQKYHVYGSSKMKRLRAFWDQEADQIVGNVVLALLEYGKAIGELKENDTYNEGVKICCRLSGKEMKSDRESSSEDFLQHEFDGISVAKLNLDSQLKPVVEQRLEEIRIALKHKASLSVVLLCGSTLEGLLQDLALKNPRLYNQAASAPKSDDGKVRQFHEWSLASLIDAAYELKQISLDVKKYSHSLRDFRNFIHPREQALYQFSPDSHTAKICLQVLLATIANLSGNRA